jgi:hypothetical protein
MESLSPEISTMAAAIMRALNISVDPELLPEVLALLTSMSEGAEKITLALRLTGDMT